MKTKISIFSIVWFGSLIKDRIASVYIVVLFIIFLDGNFTVNLGSWCLTI